MKLFKFLLIVFLTKWLADIALRAADSPQVESSVVHLTKLFIKRTLLAFSGAVFTVTGFILAILSAAESLDEGREIFSYRTWFSLAIFAVGLVIILYSMYQRTRPRQVQHNFWQELIHGVSSFLGQGHATRPRTVDVAR